MVSENATDAVLIKTLLKEDFEDVFVKVCPEAHMAAAEFLELRPKVLLLAYRELDKAEQCYLGLFRSHGAGGLRPHRTVLLCTKESVRQAFELSRRGLFDDYVLFWPMTHDAPRLRMTVHRALAELASGRDGAPSPLTIAAQAHRILELEALLAEKPTHGEEHVGATRNVRFPIGSISASLPQPSRDGNTPKYLGAATDSLDAPASQIRPVVLIVDDDEFQQKLLSLMLEPEGYQVIIAANGTEALRQLSRSPADIILMDFNLPNLDGIEVTKQLKADPRLAAIPVIMITGSSERDIVVGSRRIGVADFIVKPVERGIILDKLRRLCASTAPTAARPQ